ncbi:MAG: hypothetical protein ACQERC_01310 [Bacteroidota bacterium]
MKTNQISNLIRCVVIFLFLFMNYFTSFSQEENKENGFYVNYGNTKVDSLNCFNFDNLVYTVEITEEMFKYDNLIFKVEIYNSKLNKYDIFLNSATAEGRIFQNKVQDKKYISFLIVGNSLESKMRENLAFTTEEKFTEDMVLRVQINGGVITGYEEKWNSYTDSYVTEPTYTYTNLSLSNNKIDIKNRKKTTDPTMRQTPLGSIIYLFISKEKKDRTISTADNCYSYEGSEEFATYLYKDFK